MNFLFEVGFEGVLRINASVSNEYTGRYEISTAEYPEESYWLDWGGWYDTYTGTGLVLFYEQFLTQVTDVESLNATSFSFYYEPGFGKVVMNLPRLPQLFDDNKIKTQDLMPYLLNPLNPLAPSDNILRGKEASLKLRDVPNFKIKLSEAISGVNLNQSFSVTLSNEDGEFDGMNLIGAYVNLKKAIVENPTYEDFITLRSGYISNQSTNFNEVTFEVDDKFRSLDNPANLIHETLLTELPIVFGTVEVDLIRLEENGNNYIAGEYISAVSACYNRNGDSVAFTFDNGIITSTASPVKALVTGYEQNTIGEIIVWLIENRSGIPYVDSFWNREETNLYINKSPKVNTVIKGSSVKNAVQEVLKSDMAYFMTGADDKFTIRQYNEKLMPTMELDFEGDDENQLSLISEHGKRLDMEIEILPREKERTELKAISFTDAYATDGQMINGKTDWYIPEQEDLAINKSWSAVKPDDICDSAPTYYEGVNDRRLELFDMGLTSSQVTSFSVVGNKVYMAEYNGRRLWKYDYDTKELETKTNFFPSSLYRYSAAYDERDMKIYLPETEGRTLWIVDTSDDSLETKANFVDASLVVRQLKIMGDIALYGVDNSRHLRWIDLTDTSFHKIDNFYPRALTRSGLVYVKDENTNKAFNFVDKYLEVIDLNTMTLQEEVYYPDAGTGNARHLDGLYYEETREVFYFKQQNIEVINVDTLEMRVIENPFKRTFEKRVVREGDLVYMTCSGESSLKSTAFAIFNLATETAETYTNVFPVAQQANRRYGMAKIHDEFILPDYDAKKIYKLKMSEPVENLKMVPKAFANVFDRSSVDTNAARCKVGDKWYFIGSGNRHLHTLNLKDGNVETKSNFFPDAVQRENCFVRNGLIFIPGYSKTMSIIDTNNDDALITKENPLGWAFHRLSYANDWETGNFIIIESRSGTTAKIEIYDAEGNIIVQKTQTGIGTNVGGICIVGDKVYAPAFASRHLEIFDKNTGDLLSSFSNFFTSGLERRCLYVDGDLIYIFPFNGNIPEVIDTTTMTVSYLPASVSNFYAWEAFEYNRTLIIPSFGANGTMIHTFNLDTQELKRYIGNYGGQTIAGSTAKRGFTFVPEEGLQGNIVYLNHNTKILEINTDSFTMSAELERVKVEEAKKKVYYGGTTEISLVEKDKLFSVGNANFSFNTDTPTAGNKWNYTFYGYRPSYPGHKLTSELITAKPLSKYETERFYTDALIEISDGKKLLKKSIDAVKLYGNDIVKQFKTDLSSLEEAKALSERLGQRYNTYKEKLTIYYGGDTSHISLLDNVILDATINGRKFSKNKEFLVTEINTSQDILTLEEK